MDRWDVPVTFETRRLGQFRTVASTSEAARALLEDWPEEENEATTEAMEVCLTVLEGNGDPAAARDAFIKAAEEAGVFIRD
jgi:Arc/MetJ-type ribon-helix-helix transcriptional regulator